MNSGTRADIAHQIAKAVEEGVAEALRGPQLKGVAPIIENINVYVNSPRGGGATVNVTCECVPGCNSPVRDYRRPWRRAQ